MTQTLTKQELKFTDLVPTEWVNSETGPLVWFTAFRIVNLTKEDLSSRPITVDLLGVHAIIFYGTFPYLDLTLTKWELGNESNVQVHVPDLKVNNSREGACLILFSRYLEGDPIYGEAETQKRIASVKALFASVCGQNIVYERICDNVINLQDGRFMGFAPVFKNPHVIPAPKIDETTISVLQLAAKTITARSKVDQSRILLALHWYETALNDDGIDAFLKYWIALEVLVMPDTTNIGPLNSLLAQAYKITTQDVGEKFFLLVGFSVFEAKLFTTAFSSQCTTSFPCILSLFSKIFCLRC